MLQVAAYIVLGLSFIAFFAAFVEPSKLAGEQKEAKSAPASRWGLGLVTLGYALVWFYVRPVGFHKSTAALIASMLLGPPSAALGWAAARHLGKQWRFKAAISQDHELIQTGPYAWLRHPIYTAMFGLFLSSAFAWTWWPMGVAATIAFIAGTEIRVRAEDRLLAERFGAAFYAYRARVKAYIPFVR